MSEMTFSEDLVWALRLSFFPAVPIYQRRDGPIIMANASELPLEESEEHAARWITSRQDTVKRKFGCST